MAVRARSLRSRVWAVLALLLSLAACAPTTTPPTPTSPPPTAIPTPQPTPVPIPTLAPAPTLPPPPSLGLLRLWRSATNDTVWQIGATDVEGDGRPDVYAASYDHSLYLLDAKGALRWSYPTSAPLYAAIAADLNGDGRPELLCSGEDGTVRAVGGDGQELWSYAASGRIAYLAAGDIDRNGRTEVVAAAWDGALYILDDTGKEQNRILLAALPTVLVTVDLDGDRQAEILVGAADGSVRVLDASGQVRWRHGLEGAVRGLVTADVDRDGRHEVVAVSRDGVVALIGSDGTPRWARHAAGTVVSVATLPQDELIILGRTDGLLAIGWADGQPAWEQTIGSGVWTVAVLESKSEPVLAAGTDDGTIVLLDRRGQVRGSTQLPSRVHGLLWADLDGNGQAELLARSGDYVYAFRQGIKGEAGEGIRTVATFPFWPDPSPLSPVPDGHVAVVIAGDVMLARSIEERMAAYGPLYPFQAMAPLLQQADVAVANLESVFTLGGEPAAMPFIQRAHPGAAVGLKEAGFDLLNLANNHALDYGPTGLSDTISVLGSLGIRTIGAGVEGAAPVVFEVRGLRLAFLARNAAEASPDGIAGAWDQAALQRDIRLARSQADAVVLLLHTGQDPTDEPSAEQRALARAAVDAGAALVVGYHRYRILDSETYGQGFIAYGLGDFISDIDIEDAARDGVVLRALLSKSGLARLDWIPTRSVNDVQPQAVAAPGGRLAAVPLLVNIAEPLPPPPSPRPTYVLSATLVPEEALLTVRQQILFPNATGGPLSDLNLFVFANAYSGTFFLEDVEVEQRGRLAPPSYTLAGTTLHVFLNASVPPGEAITVTLAYSLSLPPLDAQFEPPVDNLGYTSDGRIFQLGHWYPQLVPYRRGRGWETWVYVPVGDPFFTDLASYRVMLTAPSDLLVAASAPGRLEGNSHYYSLDPARDFALVAGRNYDALSAAVDGITVTSVFRREDAVAGRAVLDNAVRALELFQERYGPYPYGAFTAVEGEMFGGMEYSGMVLLGSPFYAAYQALEDRKERSVLPALTVHELAHQWWYNVVGNDQVHEPWLDESLARYSELVYYEAAYSQSVDWWWESRIEAWNPTGYVDGTIYDYPDTDTYVHNLYGQGAHFIRDLRARLGDELFFTFLQRYYREYAWQRAVRRDFFRLVNETGVAVDDLVQVYFQK